MIHPFKKILLILSMMFTSISASSESNSIMFTKNPDVSKIAEGYSLDCIDWVKAQTRMDLDWSDSSIQHIEGLLNSLSEMAAKNPPPPERVQDFSKMFGFYIGEVYRKNHGGVVWGDVIIDGKKYYGLGNPKTGEAFIWPNVKANKRIVLGAEENVWVYYQAITEK